MRKLNVFQNLSLDGYFVDSNGSMDWAKEGNDEEFMTFAQQNAQSGGLLLFGRTTYEMMASFWPTKQAQAAMPVLAARMNAIPKIVFSRTLQKPAWNNTTLLKGRLLEEIRSLKAGEGPGMTILGSGSIVAQLAAANLIDEYQVVINPVALGTGRSMFEGIGAPLRLKLLAPKVFRNGKVFLSYQPVAN
jgi:dihydrofolate reductase